MIFTTASSESIIYIFNCENYELDTFTLPEELQHYLFQVARKKKKKSGIFTVEKARELTSKFVKQQHFSKIFNEAAGTDEYSIHV